MLATLDPRRGRGAAGPTTLEVPTIVSHHCCAAQVDWNLADAHGKAPAHYACEKGGASAMEMLKHLQIRKADLLVRDANGRTPAHYAADGRQLRCLKFLSDASSLALSRADGARRTIAHYCAAIGDVEALQLLIDAGVDVATRDRRGRTPAHDACQHAPRDAMAPSLDVIATAAAGKAIVDNVSDERRGDHAGRHVVGQPLAKQRVGAAPDAARRAAAAASASDGLDDGDDILRASTVLISGRVSLSTADDEGRTCAHLACEMGNVELLAQVRQPDRARSRARPCVAQGPPP